MAWTIKTENSMLVKTETVTGPNVTVVYSSEISTIGPDLSREKRYITIGAKASASFTSDGVIQLYGAFSSGGTKFALCDVDTTLTTILESFPIDLNAYPAPYYYIGVKSTGNNSAKTVDLYITAK